MSESRAGLRRIPTQARSRERVERILAAARELLVEGGPDGLRPTDVARRAGVPIGSVYQYFSDRHDLVAVLVERYFDQVRGMLLVHLSEVETLEDVLEGMKRAAAEWWRLHEDEPSFRPLLHAIQGDVVLQRANIEDSRASAALLVRALRPHVRDPQAMERTVLMVNHLFVPALQLALAHPTEEEQQAVFGSWLDIAESAIRGLVDD